jgi:hypothetical protein
MTYCHRGLARFATTRSLLARNISSAEDSSSARIKFMKWTARIAMTFIAGFLLGSPLLMVSASATPAGVLHDASGRAATSGYITKVWYDCEGCYHHSRYQSHHRRGSDGCHSRHLSHCRSGSYREWHGSWRSHHRHGSEGYWHSRWRSHHRWSSEY